MRRRLLWSMVFAAGFAMSSQSFAQSNESGSLRLMTFGGEAQLTAVKHAVARFNQKYPNVKVEVAIDPITNGWGDYVTKVLSEFNAHDAYDVYGTATETFRTFESRKLFMPLNDYLAKSTNASDIAPSLLQYGAYQGQTYFIPSAWNNIMINYNRALFKAAGVDLPKPGWTWNDFRETAKKLTIKDPAGNVKQYGYEVPNQFFFVQPWFYSNGTSIVNADWTASNMLDPKVSETLQFLHDLIHVDKVSPIPGKNMLDNQFMAGQIAMISRGHWIVQNAIKAKLDMDVAIPPAKANDTTVIGLTAYGIAATTKNKALAEALLTELTSPETQKEEGELGGAVPSRKSVAESPAFLKFPASAFLYDQTLPHTQSVPAPANFQEIEKIFIRYYDAMMSGDMTIAEGVKRCHEEMQASFKRLAARKTD
jgi:multiple sugar transport system substrate-binding protein